MSESMSRYMAFSTALGSAGTAVAALPGVFCAVGAAGETEGRTVPTAPTPVSVAEGCALPAPGAVPDGVAGKQPHSKHAVTMGSKNFTSLFIVSFSNYPA